jgi:GMP synthase (glutamine-hydrolysing)
VRGHPSIALGAFSPDRPDSVVLRHVDSTDGMTARSLEMDPALLQRMTTELLALSRLSAVLYDLSRKPPATIEWE